MIIALWPWKDIRDADKQESIPIIDQINLGKQQIKWNKFEGSGLWPDTVALVTEMSALPYTTGLSRWFQNPKTNIHKL